MSHRPVDQIDRALIRADLRVADAWLATGRLEDALALARELEGKTDDEELRQEIAKWIEPRSPS